jgi:hypothetical protein
MAPSLANDTLKAYVPVSTGFGGPGENPYVEDIFNDDIFKYNSDDEEIPSLFQPRVSEDDDNQHEYDDRGSQASDANGPKKPILPNELAPNAPASDVIKAWASRLSTVYELCMPPGFVKDSHAAGSEEGDHDVHEDDDVRKTGSSPTKSGKGAINLFGWGNRSGDSAEKAETASPDRSQEKKHHRHSRKHRKFQRGNNAGYDWQVRMAL